MSRRTVRVWSIASCVCFVVCATLFVLTRVWWLFPLSLLFQVGIFVPEWVSRRSRS